MQLIDTHCHLAALDFPIDPVDCLTEARLNGVEKILLASADEDESLRSLDFANQHENVWASVGVHPHHAKDGVEFLRQIDFTQPKLVAIGEIGLDYHYDFSPRDAQQAVLRFQIELALEYSLPIIFHVREAFDDFWQIIRDYDIKRAVVHSFSDNAKNLAKILIKDWFVGLNGIITFINQPDQLAVYKSIPLNKILLETDAPYLAPVPMRGKTNQPAYIKYVAEFLSKQHNLTVTDLANQTSRNAELLFSI